MRRLLLALSFVCIPVALLVASTVKGLDHFTTVSQTELSLHAPDTGTAWTKSDDPGASAAVSAHADDYALVTDTITSNYVIYTMAPNPALSSADYDVSLTYLTTTTGSADKDPLLVIGRYAAATDLYAFGVDSDAAQSYGLFKIVGGTPTLLASGSITLAPNDVFKLSMRVDTIKVFQNATQLACVVDTGVTAAGAGGFALGNLGNAVWGAATADVSSVWHFDDFTITDFTGDGGDDNCGAGAANPKGLMLMGVGGHR